MKIASKIASILLLTILTFGCSKNIIINVDGMPVSTHEYNLTNNETKIRIVFVLTSYYREYEGKEYIIKPEYLDVLEVNEINPEVTEQLTLHIKTVNLKKQFFGLNWEVRKPDGNRVMGLLYAGHLSRKDFFINLPIDEPGGYEFSFRLNNMEESDLFSLPQMGYTVKGGAKAQKDHK